MKYKHLDYEHKKDILEIYNDKNHTKAEAIEILSQELEVSKRTIYGWINKLSKENIGNSSNTDKDITIVSEETNEKEISIVGDESKKNKNRNPKIEIDNDYFVKGTSILYDDEGNKKLSWIKSDIKKDTEFNNIKLAIEDLIKEVKPINEIQLNDTVVLDEELLTFYPLPDLHFGLLVSKEESNHGYNYDLKIARKWVLESMKYLVKTSPNSKKALIVDLGDFLHSSDNNNRTKSGHVLDVDGRHYRIVKVAYEVTQLLIEEALKKHEEVIFYSIPGNHSDLAGIGLKAYLSAYYKDNNRVQIIDEHKSQQYYTYGKNIIGFSHGHELRPEKASEVMVYDNQEIFSNSLYRYYHFGHFHSNKMFESALCKVEIHKNIIPRDSWAEGMGFRGSIGEAKSITYHQTYGEISRNTFNIKMIED